MRCAQQVRQSCVAITHEGRMQDMGNIDTSSQGDIKWCTMACIHAGMECCVHLYNADCTTIHHNVPCVCVHNAPKYGTTGIDPPPPPVSLTCQQTLGFLFSRMYWVNGDGSNSYLSNGKFSTSIGSVSEASKRTTGCTSRAG